MQGGLKLHRMHPLSKDQHDTCPLCWGVEVSLEAAYIMSGQLKMATYTRLSSRNKWPHAVQRERRTDAEL